MSQLGLTVGNKGNDSPVLEANTAQLRAANLAIGEKTLYFASDWAFKPLGVDEVKRRFENELTKCKLGSVVIQNTNFQLQIMPDITPSADFALATKPLFSCVFWSKFLFAGADHSLVAQALSVRLSFPSEKPINTPGTFNLC
ncbi:hypothetical protein F5884DRAFT_859569 [Xylogone sp. PMI_703]|nr:hypothetical protein F5884DRAFT_859569 [Xylogone sp. PMI_703]